jgi:hypothetical protein
MSTVSRVWSLVVNAIDAVVLHPHFLEYTLSSWQLQQVFILFSIILSTILAVGYYFLGHDRNRYGWLVSAVNSGVMSLVGFFYVLHVVRSFPGFYTYQATDLTLIHDQDNVCMIATTWFIVSNAFDLVAGHFLYPQCMDLVTGYIHHSVFIVVLLVGLEGNGYFFQCSPYVAAFANSLIEEVPTFFLALNGLFPNLNTDIPFGISFVLFRIIHHSFNLYYAFKLKSEIISRVMLAGTFIMHVQWFLTWFQGIRVKYSSPKTDLKKQL